MQIGAGLAKTRLYLAQGFKSIFSGKAILDEKTLDRLTEMLIGADMGVVVAQRLINALKISINKKEATDYDSLKKRLKLEIKRILINGGEQTVPVQTTVSSPVVTLFMGINGVGKTTTIAKVAALLRRGGKTVLLAAGDTFRAGAIEQLSILGKRVGVEVIASSPGADPSSVAFNAVQTALSQKIDHLLIDTAGRLQTNSNLMEELKKMNRVVAKALAIPSSLDATIRRILVLDGTTGQNAISQAKQFHAEMGGISGIILTKLDTMARGGVLIPIVEALPVPILYLGMGEGMEDLFPFQIDSFIEALFEDPPTAGAPAAGGGE